MTIEHLQLTWISSSGGPLLLLSEEHLNEWEGIRSPSGGRIVHANFRWGPGNAQATHYDRACDVNDYLGLVEVGSGWGLILGDAPAATAWYAHAAANGGMLVRWDYAEDERDIVETLPAIPENSWRVEPFTFTVGTFPLYLFDSAYDNSCREEAGDYLIIELEAGSYAIATCLHRPDKFTLAIVHHFSLPDR